MYEVIVYQVILGAVLGVLIGIVARKCLRWAHDKQYVPAIPATLFLMKFGGFN